MANMNINNFISIALLSFGLSVPLLADEPQDLDEALCLMENETLRLEKDASATPRFEVLAAVIRQTNATLDENLLWVVQEGIEDFHKQALLVFTLDTRAEKAFSAHLSHGIQQCDHAINALLANVRSENKRTKAIAEELRSIKSDLVKLSASRPNPTKREVLREKRRSRVESSSWINWDVIKTMVIVACVASAPALAAAANVTLLGNETAMTSTDIARDPERHESSNWWRYSEAYGREMAWSNAVSAIHQKPVGELHVVPDGRRFFEGLDFAQDPVDKIAKHPYPRTQHMPTLLHALVCHGQDKKLIRELDFASQTVMLDYHLRSTPDGLTLLDLARYYGWPKTSEILLSYMKYHPEVRHLIAYKHCDPLGCTPHAREEMCLDWQRPNDSTPGETPTLNLFGRIVYKCMITAFYGSITVIAVAALIATISGMKDWLDKRTARIAEALRIGRGAEARMQENAGADCVICYDRPATANPHLLRQCIHSGDFCTQCLLGALESSNTCPVCRGPGALPN
jgi:hypothetical protein